MGLSIFMSILSNPIMAITADEELGLWLILNQLNFLFTTILLIIIVFEDDIKRLTLENQKLNTQIEKSRVFVNLGENISGLVHNMNGDLGLMSMAVSMLEEDVEHKAVEFVRKGNKNLQSKIRNILTLAKYSQAETDMEFSINALLYSLLEVFNINKQFRIVTTNTEFTDEVFFYGNPSEISQIFENLLKNAYEALVEYKTAMDEQGHKDYDPVLTIGIKGQTTESIISFSDNGPGIKACLEKDCTGDCSRCDAFKVGRTTKKEGTGLGMVSVLRTLEKYEGNMKIRTSPEGTVIEIILARG
ncbi:ATP-binding protein [Spirochaeta isovalerica]|nr:HAMP domain-containing sensor histidine kinase [Spirochaeta isovalerica]